MNVRFEGNNGHEADVKRCLLMALSGEWAFRGQESAPGTSIIARWRKVQRGQIMPDLNPSPISRTSHSSPQFRRIGFQINDQAADTNPEPGAEKAPSENMLSRSGVALRSMVILCPARGGFGHRQKAVAIPA